ncbi:MAG: hypothetical protein V4520_06985 [Bacteroidota bacterium]
MIYQNLIDVSLLNNLINVHVDSIYSNGLTVYKNHIETQLFTIRLENKSWLNFTNQAKETPNNNDYYKFLINHTSVPNINYDDKWNSIAYPFSKISFKSAKIECIEIYNRAEKYDDETLDYDVLILFKCNKKFQFIISLEERVDEAFVYSSNSKTINRYLTGLKLRTTL